METPFAMEEYVTEQIRIARDVFGNMADMSIEPVGDSWKPQAESVTSAVHFTEPWQASLFVDCSLPLALTFTGRLLAIEAPTSVNEDVLDAVRELANMIGGNLKAVMPSTVCMSVPMIVREQSRESELCGARRLSTIVFLTEFGDFCLTLLTLIP